MTKYLAVLALIMLIGAASGVSISYQTIQPLTPDQGNLESILTTLGENGVYNLSKVDDTLNNLGYESFHMADLLNNITVANERVEVLLPPNTVFTITSESNMLSWTWLHKNG